LNLSNAKTSPTIDGHIADRLLQAARDPSPVSGLTHTFYRYPARFSPPFVRAAIELFTKPGDVVLDPYLGGGTALVEALALGRRGVGADISSLATFVTQVKTTLLSHQELLLIRSWGSDVKESINIHGPSPKWSDWTEECYQKHLRTKSIWRLRKAIEQVLESAKTFNSAKLERFARCIVLRTAQWALDSRKRLPSVAEFRERIVENLQDMITGAAGLRLAAERAASGNAPLRPICLHRSAVGLDEDERVKNLAPPKLVLTSPPYPGIHVLYHRWQVDGRKETPAPFWIARKLDGSGASYYTMGDRKEQELKTYYDTLAAAFQSIARLCDERTTVLQMVAFASPEWQLPRYLEVMQDAGFRECQLANCIDAQDGRLWRAVPNRRWHADQKGETSSSREVVLVHKLARPIKRLLPRSLTDSPHPRQFH